MATGKRAQRVALASLACLIATNMAGAHEHDDAMPVAAKLGTVSFEIACKPEQQGDFNRAVALLHSFWHNEAQHAFEEIAAADPSCAIAYWGEAMAHFHLGLSWPTAADLTAGAEALTKADAATDKSPREAAYIRALHVLYDGFSRQESWVYSQRYSEAMAGVVTAYPSDLEAKVFYALALILSEPPDDADLIETKKAVQVLTPLLREHPDHPGIAHYLIHACDTPQLAQQGLGAARRYAQIAPASPHALHMPSHIFVRLGLWQEDIRSNRASKAAAENATGMHVGAEHRLHAMEFLEYAYLQTGHDDEARAIISDGKAIPRLLVDPRYGNYYASVEARFPTMFAIETHDWPTAAHAEPLVDDDGSGQRLTLLAHAIAAGHLRDRALANATLQASQVFMKGQYKGRPLPRSGTAEATFPDEIQAWKDFANRDLNGALRLLRPIADRQDKVGKGELDLPVREMLAEMLLLSGKAIEALKEYKRSLQSDPNRFNGLLGAGRAAEKAGQQVLAIGYYRALLANCDGATGPAVAQLEHARQMVGVAETVSFDSGGKTLHGFIYKPAGPGPFPTVLYNHGSSPGMINNAAFEALGPMFVAHGWAFFAPYRRGQGLSSDAGEYIGDAIAAARAEGGLAAAADTMVRLLSTDHLQDQFAALSWLKSQPFVNPGQIAVMGNSFGGVETVLGAEHGGYCAAVDASGGAESWNLAPSLRSLMVHAAQRARAPILFFQATNDYTVAPSRELYAAMREAKKPAEIRLYPPYGNSPEDGHSLPYRGADIWRDDVFRFLDKSCTRVH